MQSKGLRKDPEKCEVLSEGNPKVAQKLADNLGMKFAGKGFLAAGCPLGSSEWVQSHANSSADKVVSLIQRVLELPFSAQDKLLLRRSFWLKILHLPRVAHQSDVPDAISTVEKEIVAGVLFVMQCWKHTCLPSPTGDGF
jgi:hypothetical protein